MQAPVIAQLLHHLTGAYQQPDWCWLCQLDQPGPSVHHSLLSQEGHQGRLHEINAEMLSNAIQLVMQYACWWEHNNLQ
jgi:hypothetical protein